MSDNEKWGKPKTPVSGSDILFDKGAYWTDPDENGVVFCCGVIDHFKIYLKQIGGSYCGFTCPECGYGKAEMKMSSNYGHCEKCDTQYQMQGSIKVSNGDADKVDYYCDLEVMH
jgi:hypothetical protein